MTSATEDLGFAPFTIGDGERAVRVGEGDLFIIAGPCVVESRDSVLRHCSRLRDLSDELALPIIFKASFDKANRTSYESFRGAGMDDGLRFLEEAGRETGMPLLTDVHDVSQCAATAEVVDVLQIPALLCRQTDLIRAAAATGRTVNIKKGQFLAPWDMKHALAKATSVNRGGVMLTERGSTFGYGNLVNDFRSLVIMADLGAPVIFDATHSVQLPGGGGNVSTGQREFVAPLARAAVAVGVAGVFMEVHEDPDNALSDGPNSYPLDVLPDFLRGLKALHDTARELRAKEPVVS